MGFLDFLTEANGNGSKFESRVANAVNRWLKSNGMSNKFEATRFQKITEDDGNRDEDYSDVVITDLATDKRFFIECKQSVKDNCVTIQFDINPDDFTLIPVKNKDRQEIVDNSIITKLADDIYQNQEYQQFKDFLTTDITVGTINCQPKDFYFDLRDVTDPELNSLIAAYNKLIKNNEVESDNKPFDGELIRESTRNMLACALIWRLSDTTRTWDICHLKDIPYFKDLLLDHYLENKEIPVTYLQLGTDCLFKLSDNNPLMIDCSQLPDEILGQYDIKFTPRFGTGSMYVTPRSKILSDVSSKCSFLDKDHLPHKLS